MGFEINDGKSSLSSGADRSNDGSGGQIHSRAFEAYDRDSGGLVTYEIGHRMKGSHPSSIMDAYHHDDIADSTLKSIDISSCGPSSDGDREITMEDFLEIEEFLELEDGENLRDLDSSREVTMEDFLELEEWLDSEQKLDDEQNAKRKDLETSSKTRINRQQLDEIDRHPPYIVDQRPPYIIDRHPPDSIELHPPDCIELHPPDCIDRHPWLDELPGYILELEQVEERMYMSKASHLSVPKHQRPPTWTEEATEFHKRVKRIHDPVKIVVPCDVFEAESPIPQDKSIHLSSYSGVFDDHICVEASQRRGLRFRGEVDNMNNMDYISINIH
ncbi:hypothetical protein DY000_02021004 [Brassica cretica]|uniref:EF-hand domain-containing protein n=1 Tax=Brassica cretica TaxID=69181 RepID=A0ABQ7ED46_BRACR|nr:hypothetical protein DY000_02021004 [Brassica cretica]